MTSVKRRLFQDALNGYVRAADPDTFLEKFLAEIRKDIEDLKKTAQD